MECPSKNSVREKLMANKEKFSGLIKSRISGFPSDHLITASQVWLDAGDVMSRDVGTISSDETVVSAVKVMSENNISCIVVVDNETVVGILTETDFLKKVVACIRFG
ncbi:unnamed protein product [marine sediment metagenome]|uniref:CBS domain-containing protein n=1 Tax=marine sediment metagenome TaxID=412755 RepID=X1E2K7_9ZZZZ